MSYFLFEPIRNLVKVKSFPEFTSNVFTIDYIVWYLGKYPRKPLPFGFNTEKEAIHSKVTVSSVDFKGAHVITESDLLREIISYKLNN